jgi:hypothetical protein
MLAEYQEEIFNAKELDGHLFHIWKYKPTKGFEKRIDDNTVCYEKDVEEDEIRMYFSISFCILMDNRKFPISKVVNGNIDITCEDQSYASTHEFTNSKKGIWSKRKSMDDTIQCFQIIKCDELNGTQTSTILRQSEFLEAWSKYVVEIGKY